MGQDVLRPYLIGTVIVWVGTIAALAILLGDTPYFGQVLTVLLGGIVWFLVIVPGALLRRRERL